MSTTPSTPRAPLQARSRDTQARITEALRELLTEKPLDAIGVQELALRAGVSVGGFYRRFSGKEHALAHLLYEGYVARMEEAAAQVLAPARWEGADTAELVRAYFGMMVEVGLGHLPVLRELVRRHRENPDEMARSEAGQRFRERVHVPFVRLLSGRAGTFSHPDPELALRFAFSGCSSILREAILFPHMQPRMGKLPQGALVEELTRMFCAYLGVPLPSAVSSSSGGTPDAPHPPTPRRGPRAAPRAAAPRARRPR